MARLGGGRQALQQLADAVFLFWAAGLVVGGAAFEQLGERGPEGGDVVQKHPPLSRMGSSSCGALDGHTYAFHTPYVRFMLQPLRLVGRLWRRSGPAHSDGGQLLHAVGGEGRGSGSLVADPCTEPEVVFLCLRPLVVGAAVRAAADDKGLDVLSRYA